jgi:hypothetical protein
MPRIVGHTPQDRWEQEVLKRLRLQCPASWTVMPSVRWALVTNRYVRDGETDFVILIPDSGFIVLEVKGSKEFRVDECGIWHRLEGSTWIALSEPPPAQAARNMFAIRDRLCDRFGWREFPGRFGFLVAYPQGEARTLPPMFDESTLATRRHMNDLPARLRNVLDRRAPDKLGDNFTIAIASKIADDLANCQFAVRKADTDEDLSQDTAGIELLTRQQFATLRGLFGMPRVGVIGPAGSGKTLLAVWRLKASIDEGKRAIYICFNKSLAESLRSRNPDVHDSIKHVDGFLRGLCPSVAAPLDAGLLTAFFRDQLPGEIIDRARQLEKYDCIIVDEGQDFSEMQLVALLDLLRDEEDSTWALFADWRQDLYAAGEHQLIGCDAVFSLHYNCRNTVQINAATNGYLDAGQDVKSMPGMPEGVAPTLELLKNEQAIAQRAWQLAREWAGTGPVAILSPFTLEHSSMSASRSGHGLRLVEGVEKLGAAGTILFSTIKSFKGIEATSVIVIDVDIPGDHPAFGPEDLYVACTRGTSRLALLTTRKAAFDRLATAPFTRHGKRSSPRA